MQETFKTKVKQIGGSFYALIPSWVLKANSIELSDEQEVILKLEEVTHG